MTSLPVASALPPPAGWLWAYRLLGLRVPGPHRAWVARDVADDRGLRVLLAWRLLPALMAWTALVAVLRPAAALSVFVVSLAAAVGSQFGLPRKRSGLLRFQRVGVDGAPVPPCRSGRLGNVTVVALLAAALVLVAGLAVAVLG